MTTAFPHGSVTLVFTDIENSSELWEQFRSDFQPLLDEHNVLIREATVRWNGHEVKSLGDSFFLVFSNADDAVAWAVDVQKRFMAHEWPEVRGKLRIRIGMHTGEPHCATQPAGQIDYFGPAVNRAARIEAAAHGGQIVISDATRESAIAQLSAVDAQITLRDLGRHRLKGIGDERLFQVLHPALTGEFPPLRTDREPRIKLPAFVTPFMERAVELEEVRGLLLQDGLRLLIITGPGGVGKTRLSVAAAEDVAADFIDGVVFVDLETVSSAEDFWSSSDFHLEVPAREGTRHNSILQFLREKRLLLVMDNIEQVEGASQVLESLVRSAPGVKCLIAARERLPLDGATIYALSPLDVPPFPQPDVVSALEYESVRFFQARARAHHRTFELNSSNIAHAVELCRQLEGLPLGLELATAWVADMTVREIVDELSIQFDVLSTESSSVPVRQRALRSSIDWSFTRLTYEEQEAAMALSVFAGGIGREAAAVVCGKSKMQSITLLRRLHAKSLLISEEIGDCTRFHILRPIRRYLCEQLAISTRSIEFRLRHAEYFLGFAQERLKQLRSSREIEALNQLNLERENLRSALEWSVESGKSHLAAPLALALGQFLDRRGLQHEAAHYIAQAAGQAALWPRDEEKTALLWIELRQNQAFLHLDQFQWEEARHKAEEALRNAEQWKDISGMASSLNLLGLTACRQKQFDVARFHLEAAKTLYEQLEDTAGRANVLHNLGLAANLSQQIQTAQKYFEEALALRRQVGDERGLAETFNNLGVLAQEQDQWDDAWHYYLKSLNSDKAICDTFGIGRALFNLGEIAEAREEWRRSQLCFAVAERVFGQIGSPYQSHAADAAQRAAKQSTNAQQTAEEVADFFRRSRTVEEVVDWVEAKAQLTVV